MTQSRSINMGEQHGGLEDMEQVILFVEWSFLAKQNEQSLKNIKSLSLIVKSNWIIYYYVNKEVGKTAL